MLENQLCNLIYCRTRGYSGNIFVIFVEMYCQSKTSPIAFFPFFTFDGGWGVGGGYILPANYFSSLLSLFFEMDILCSPFILWHY